MVQSRCAFLFILFFFLIIHVLARFRRFRSPNDSTIHPNTPPYLDNASFRRFRRFRSPNDQTTPPNTPPLSSTPQQRAISPHSGPGRPNIFQRHHIVHSIHVLARFRGFRPSDDSNNPRDVFQHHHHRNRDVVGTSGPDNSTIRPNSLPHRPDIENASF